jgi:hypothetical protein
MIGNLKNIMWVCRLALQPGAGSCWETGTGCSFEGRGDSTVMGEHLIHFTNLCQQVVSKTSLSPLSGEHSDVLHGNAKKTVPPFALIRPLTTSSYSPPSQTALFQTRQQRSAERDGYAEPSASFLNDRQKVHDKNLKPRRNEDREVRPEDRPHWLGLLPLPFVLFGSTRWSKGFVPTP